ncbi:MAG: hypothetical protein IKS55_07805 [Oscillospiraceae bacterium]|nr:hypothetical protein [Oscillospiraceae bacterium]
MITHIEQWMAANSALPQNSIIKYARRLNTVVVLIFTLLFVFFSFPSTAFGDNSAGDHQNAYDELEEIAQTYRRYVSVKANEDCSAFTVVINDAANWGRAEEIAEAQLYDFAQKHANSGNKNGIISIHYMNMNGDEVYSHSYNGSVVLSTAADNSPPESSSSYGNLAGSSGDHQNNYDELEEIAQIYRRYVSVKANEDCSSFTVVINDAANWGRAEEIAEAQLYDFAQKNANSGNKNDVIGIHYMNMNGDEIYYHRYPGSKSQTTDANLNLAENSANSVGNSVSSSYILDDHPVETAVQSNNSSEQEVSNWHLADNTANGASSTASSSYTQQDQSNLVWLSASGDCYHRIPNCGRMDPSKARQVTREEAIRQGKTACENCRPQ